MEADQDQYLQSRGRSERVAACCFSTDLVPAITAMLPFSQLF